MKKFWILLSFFCCSIVFSQKTMLGQILDFDTSIPISFAKITYNNKTINSNWEGKFSLEIQEDLKPIVVSYNGYYDKNYYLNVGSKSLLIKLVPNISVKQKEVFSENQVNTILRKVVENKYKNQPEKVLKNFEYKNYEYLLVSANPDSISEKIDTVIKKSFFGKHRIKIDSSNYKFKRYSERQHLYQTEKVNLIQYQKNKTKETILASRMAGFKKPLYEYLGLNLISYSLYENKLDILGVSIHNPISNYGKKLYVYKIIDTITIQNRTVYQIYFQPKKLDSNRIRGLLYIDAETNALCQAFFRIYGMANINALYTFNYMKENAIWFPEKRSITVVKGNNLEDITILGNTIKFNTGLDGISKNATDQCYLKLQSTPFDIKFKSETTIKHPAIKIDVPENSMSKPNEYWLTFQKDSLDIRKIPTYVSLDSLSQAEKIEHKIFLGRKIFNGYYPINIFDLDFKTLLKYNNHEGFRIGIGGVTNTIFSDKYRLSGYVAYGLKDTQFKYNLTPSYLLNKETNSWVSASYTNDVKEIGQIDFATENKRFKVYDPRPINISTFYNYKAISAFAESKYFAKTDMYFGISKSDITPLFDYKFLAKDNEYFNFNTTTLQFAIQWNPFSEYMQTSTGRLELDKKTPKIAFQYTKSFSNIFGSDFDFTKIDLRIIHEIPFLSGQKTSFTLQGGLALGDVPLTHLYSIAPNNLNRDSMLKRVTLAGNNSFETMYFNEFFSSKYATFQVKHTFNKVKLGYKLNPKFSLITRMAIGSMEKPQKHIGLEYKTLEKGFLESGVEANSIYKGFGLTFFFRYGPNGLPKLEDNLSLKISYVLDLGF